MLSSFQYLSSYSVLSFALFFFSRFWVLRFFYMMDMDGFGGGDDVGGAPNKEDLRQFADIPSGLLLRFKCCFLNPFI